MPGPIDTWAPRPASRFLPDVNWNAHITFDPRQTLIEMQLMLQ